MRQDVSGTKARHLLDSVARRQQAVSGGARSYLFLMVLASAYAVLLLSSRLFGLIPNWFTLTTLPVVPAAAAVLALIFRHKPGRAETARAIDRQADTRDLFLTTVLIEESAGEYKPLVLAEAQEQAAAIDPASVVPYRWKAKVIKAIVALALLSAATLFLPQFDPFGREQERQRLAGRHNALQESRKAAALRLAVLREKGTADLSKEVREAITELKNTLNRMKPNEKKANLQEIAEIQKELGDLWRKSSEEKLNNTLSGTEAFQSFGKGDVKKLAQWKQDLGKGETASINQELDELKELAEKMAQTSDAFEKEKLREEIRKRLENLADFVKSEVG